jgi:site-specific recombinase XerD
MKVKQAVVAYLRHLKVSGSAYYTIRTAKYGLRRFVRFLEQENVIDIEALNQDIMAEYQQELYFCLTAKGKPLTLRSQSQLLSTVKGLCPSGRPACYPITPEICCAQSSE